MKRILEFLFPKPKWVLEFEAALEADRVARQKLYDYWDSFKFNMGHSIPGWPEGGENGQV